MWNLIYILYSTVYCLAGARDMESNIGEEDYLERQCACYKHISVYNFFIKL